MSSISSISSLASTLFTRLDTKSQGFIEKTDLQSAFDKISKTGSASSSSVDEVFASLDGDSDGKVTQSEMTTSMQKLADQLDSQLGSMRMSDAMGGQGGPGGAGGMPPPPPPSGSGGRDDAGFTQDELSSQLTEIGSSDSKRSSLISNIVANFDEADTDSDGKVSMKEAMAYDQTSSTSSTTAASASASSDSSSASSSSDSNSEFAVMMKIMQLAQSYSAFDQASNQSSLSTVA